MQVRRRPGYQRYEVDFPYTDPLTGERERFRKLSPFTSKRKAERWGRDHLVRVTSRSWCLEQKEKEKREQLPTVTEFVEGEYFPKHVATKAPSTRETYRQRWEAHIRPVIGSLQIDDVKFEELEDLQAQVLAKDSIKSPKTVRNVMGITSGILSYARARRLIERVEKPELPPAVDPDWYYLTKDEAQRLVDEAEPRIQLMVYTAIRTGLRLGELLGLERIDMDDHKGVVHVRRQFTRGSLKPPKYGSKRAVPIPEGVVARLKAGFLESPPSSWAFPDEEGELLNKQRVRDPLDRAYEAAGILPHKRGWHVLRHTYASHLASQGVSLKVLSTILGHNSVKVTERYAHMLPDATGIAREVVAGFGP